ncbi:hypothetical protein MPC1_7570002 [Methylocella tundrae]|nr:hypothetical protein MPC1_7570002 [Methylocella tundrae]
MFNAAGGLLRSPAQPQFNCSALSQIGFRLGWLVSGDGKADLKRVAHVQPASPRRNSNLCAAR